MYHSSFGLQRPPFDDRVDPTVFFSTAELEEILAAIEYESLHGRGALAVIGEAGTGKSLLIRRFLLQLRPHDQVAVWNCPCGAEFSLTREVCKGFKIGVPSSQDPVRTLERLRRHLKKTSSSTDSRRAVVILDQVEHLSTLGLHELVDLVNLSEKGDRLLSLVLIGQPRFHDLIAGPEFNALRQILFGARTLPPLNRRETVEYVRFRLHQAGAGERRVFEDDVLDVVFDETGGIPRLINRACDAAMLAAYGAGESVVSLASVRGAVGVGESDATSHALSVKAAVSETFAERWMGTDATMETRSLPLRDVAPVAVSLSGAEPATATAVGELTSRSMHDALHSGEQLLDRLEDALNRTERFHDRALSVFAKYGEFEDRFVEKMRVAERLVERLTRAADLTQTVLGEVDARAESATNELNKRAQDCEARAASALRTSQEKSEALLLLCERADRLEVEVASKTRGVTSRLEEIPRAVQRMDAVLLDGEKLFARLESVREASSESMKRVDHEAERIRRRIEDSLRPIEEAEKRVDQVLRESEKIVSRLDLVRTASVEAVGFAEVESQRVRQLVNDAIRPVSDMENKLVDLRAGLSTIEARATEHQISLAKDADRIATLEEAAGLVRSQITEADRAAGKLREDLRQETATLSDLETRRQAYRDESDALAGALDELETRGASAARQATDTQRRLENLRGEAIEVDAVAKELRDAVSSAGDILNMLGSTRLEVDGTVRAAGSSKEALLVARAAIAAEIEVAAIERGQLASTRAQSADARRELTNAVAAAQETNRVTRESAVAIAESARETGIRSEEITRNLAAHVESSRRVLDDVNTVELRAAGITKDLDESMRQAESIRGGLTDATDHANAANENLQGILAAADACAAKCRDAKESIDQVLHRADTAKRAVDEVVDRALETVPNAITTLRAEVKAAAETTERVVTVAQSANESHAQLAELIRSCDAAAEQIRTESTRGTDTASSLAQQTQRASELLAAQRTGNEAATALLERANAMVGCADQTARAAAERIGKVSAEVWALTQTAEKVLAQLQEGRTLVEQLGPRIDQSVDRATEASGRLEKDLTRAETQDLRLSAGCEQAAKLVENLGTIDVVLTEACEVEERLRSQMTNALAMSEALLAAVEAAPRHANVLDSANTQASHLIAEQHELQRNIDTTFHDVLEQINARRRWVESGDKLLTEFSSRAERIGGGLGELERRLAETDQAVHRATHGEAAKIINEARGQAAQLTRVCAAVRKVSASLAKQAIEAHEKTTECQNVRQTTSSELRRLVADTQSATQTLSTWVEEGLRVQARLERVVRESPPMEKTHPADALRRAAQTAQRLRTLIPAESAPAPLATVSKESPRTEARPRTIVRPDEVAQLIDEAKRAQAVGVE